MSLITSLSCLFAKKLVVKIKVLYLDKHLSNKVAYPPTRTPIWEILWLLKIIIFVHYNTKESTLLTLHLKLQL